MGGFHFFKNSVQIKLFRFLLHLISVQCYYSVTKAFQSAFLKSSLFNIRCVLIVQNSIAIFEATIKC